MVSLGQPTPQIANLLFSLHLRQHFANILGIHNQGITVPHWPHVVDQAPRLKWAYAEQFSDLAPIDELGGYLLQRGSYQGYSFRPSWQHYISAIPMLSISRVHDIHTNHSTDYDDASVPVF
jgi:hypothetical protein